MTTKLKWVSVPGKRFIEMCVPQLPVALDLSIFQSFSDIFTTLKPRPNGEVVYQSIAWKAKGYWYNAVVAVGENTRLTFYRCPADIETAISDIIDMIDDRMAEYGYVPETRNKEGHELHGH